MWLFQIACGFNSLHATCDFEMYMGICYIHEKSNQWNFHGRNEFSFEIINTEDVKISKTRYVSVEAIVKYLIWSSPLYTPLYTNDVGRTTENCRLFQSRQSAPQSLENAYQLPSTGRLSCYVRRSVLQVCDYCVTKLAYDVTNLTNNTKFY